MTRPKQTQISVRASTHARLKERARRNGEQLSTLLDALINRYLDEKDGN